MLISVQLHTILQRQTPDGLVNHLDVDLEEGNTLSNLLDLLGVQRDVDALLLVVNGRLAEPSQVLQAGDQVNLVPAISGG